MHSPFLHLRQNVDRKNYSHFAATLSAIVISISSCMAFGQSTRFSVVVGLCGRVESCGIFDTNCQSGWRPSTCDIPSTEEAESFADFADGAKIVFGTGGKNNDLMIAEVELPASFVGPRTFEIQPTVFTNRFGNKVSIAGYGCGQLATRNAFYFFESTYDETTIPAGALFGGTCASSTDVRNVLSTFTYGTGPRRGTEVFLYPRTAVTQTLRFTVGVSCGTNPDSCPKETNLEGPLRQVWSAVANSLGSEYSDLQVRGRFLNWSSDKVVVKCEDNEVEGVEMFDRSPNGFLVRVPRPLGSLVGCKASVAAEGPSARTSNEIDISYR